MSDCANDHAKCIMKLMNPAHDPAWYYLQSSIVPHHSYFITSNPPLRGRRKGNKFDLGRVICTNMSIFCSSGTGYHDKWCFCRCNNTTRRCCGIFSYVGPGSWISNHDECILTGNSNTLPVFDSIKGCFTEVRFQVVYKSVNGRFSRSNAMQGLIY